MPDRRTHVSAVIAFGLIMTLTFDLWPWKPYQQCRFAWWVFLPDFI